MSVLEADERPAQAGDADHELGEVHGDDLDRELLLADDLASEPAALVLDTGQQDDNLLDLLGRVEHEVVHLRHGVVLPVHVDDDAADSLGQAAGIDTARHDGARSGPVSEHGAEGVHQRIHAAGATRVGLGVAVAAARRREDHQRACTDRNVRRVFALASAEAHDGERREGLLVVGQVAGGGEEAAHIEHTDVLQQLAHGARQARHRLGAEAAQSRNAVDGPADGGAVLPARGQDEVANLLAVDGIAEALAAEAQGDLGREVGLGDDVVEQRWEGFVAPEGHC